MNREEHLQWAKTRAFEYIDRGDLMNGLTSMFSDLRKHPETANHKGIQLGVLLMAIPNSRLLASRDEARRFIEGFH